ASAMPVNLNVTAGFAALTGLAVTPATLTFQYQTGAANPPTQALSVTGAAFSLTASSASWLNVSMLAGAAPAIVNVSVDPAGLTAGTYSAKIVFASSTGESRTIGV